MAPRTTSFDVPTWTAAKVHPDHHVQAALTGRRSSFHPATPTPGAGVAAIVFVSMSTHRRTSRPISSFATKTFGYGVSFSITPLEHLLAIARAIS